MCFSASASFVASGVLMVVGTAAVKSSKSPSSLPFAAIPILFSVQQFIEGLLWLALTNPEYAGWQNGSTYAFLIFAQVVWPSMAPLSIFLLEKNGKRRKILSAILAVGIVVSIYLGYCLITYPVAASASSNHVLYLLDYPHKGTYYVAIFYMAATVIPAFVSSVDKMRLFGLTILISVIITQLFFKDYLISVWCYFAAILSVIVVFIINDLKKASRVKN